MAGKHLQSFELFIKRGVVSDVGNTQSDDEFGCLWDHLNVGGETLQNVNCGQLVANKLLLAVAQGEFIEMSFVRYNNGEKDFNFIAAIKTSMGVIEDVDFSVEQLQAGADKMRRTVRRVMWISGILIVTVLFAIVGVFLLGLSIWLHRRSQRPQRFIEALQTAAKAFR